MKRYFLLLLMTMLTASAATAQDAKFIGPSQPPTETRLLTPEALWAMGRIGSAAVSPNGRLMAYDVTYYDVPQNRSHRVIYVMDMATRTATMLTKSTESESQPAFIRGGQKIAYISAASGTRQVWEMNVDGTARRMISDAPADVAEFLFSPDEAHVILTMEVPSTSSIAPQEDDLPQASGMVITDLMYKHWDQYVRSVPHPFVGDFNGNRITDLVDVLEGEPYECPMLPFGGMEQLAWSPDSRQIAYTCRKKVGLQYAISTDSDIFLYDAATHKTVKNLCKPEGYKPPTVEPTRSLEGQEVNALAGANNHLPLQGYDQNPQFSPDGKQIAWLSMARDGYESDCTRLLTMNLATGEITHRTASVPHGANEFVWGADSKTLYFTSVWHGRVMVYESTAKGEIRPLTDDRNDYTLLALLPDGKSLLAKRHSMQQADEVYRIPLKGKQPKVEALTAENQWFEDHFDKPDVQERWIGTTDGKEMLAWVVYPPHFDAAKKWPVLLFCEGGPQSPVSQFWSYRWNFSLMAAQGYIVIAPNRRGLPGFGMEWLEEISGDYSGQCMQDYLSAIDDIAREPYVDRERLGCVGASFGGYSVYWLAGHHEGRFHAFIAHDGIFNTQQQYLETEELWFPNWDLHGAPWNRTDETSGTIEGHREKAYNESPHLYVDRWDTPILCIHGQKDFRIEYTQAESAFTAARLRGLDAELLLFPDENHWVLKPQNGILWQRTFFRFLAKHLGRESY